MNAAIISDKSFVKYERRTLKLMFVISSEDCPAYNDFTDIAVALCALGGTHVNFRIDIDALRLGIEWKEGIDQGFDHETTADDLLIKAREIFGRIFQGKTYKCVINSAEKFERMIQFPSVTISSDESKPPFMVSEKRDNQ